jgi:hypothetical protein
MSIRTPAKTIDQAARGAQKFCTDSTKSLLRIRQGAARRLSAYAKRRVSRKVRGRDGSKPLRRQGNSERNTRQMSGTAIADMVTMTGKL